MDGNEQIGERVLRRSRFVMALYYFVGIIVLYLLVAYVVVPAVWKVYAHRHRSFDDSPRITKTGDGHPGDPLNVALIGEQAEVEEILKAAGWYRAAALGLRSDLKIAADTVLSRPDAEAPVSRLFLFGRKEDLAYEKPVGNNPRQRNHVRFWKTLDKDADGREIWMGAASYDEKVGFSHTTGQITHHISGDVDAERDRLFEDLKKTGRLEEDFEVPDFHKNLKGVNGGGDHWHTDGKLYVGVIKPRGA